MEEGGDEEEEGDEQDDILRSDLQEWLKILLIVLLNLSDHWRQASLLSKSMNLQQAGSPLYQYAHIHFDNLSFLMQHLLRAPDTYATNFSYLFQIPLLEIKSNTLISDLDFVLTEAATVAITNPSSSSLKQEDLFMNLNLSSSQSDPLIRLYFDFYLKLFAGFSYEPKYRRQFLFINLSKSGEGRSQSNEAKSTQWELIDSDGDLESLEQSLVDLSEDDLIKLYYQIPLNKIFAFLWSYLGLQKEVI